MLTRTGLQEAQRYFDKSFAKKQTIENLIDWDAWTEYYLGKSDARYRKAHAALSAAQQKMHPTLGKSAASDSESKPAPKRVI